MNTAIVTLTRARGPEESSTLLDSLRHLGQLGLPVYAADSASIAPFLTQAAQIENVHVIPSEPGLVTQIQTALRHASAKGHALLIYTEPDKQDFFISHMPAFIHTAQSDASLEVLIAARNEAAFATFPEGQQAAERALNQLANDLLRDSLRNAPLPDLVYGPLALRLHAVAHALKAPRDLGWGWRIYAIAACVLAGRKREFLPWKF